MNVVFQAILPAVAILGLGVLMRARIIIDDGFWRQLDSLAYFVFLPGLILSTFLSAGMSRTPIGSLGLTFLIANLAMLAILVVSFALSPSARRNAASYSTVFQTSTRWNIPVALVVATQLHGHLALEVATVAILVSVPLLNIANIAFMLFALRQHKRWPAAFAKALIFNPIVLSCLAGVAINALDWPLWPPIRHLADALGQASLSVMLLSIGAGIVGMTRSTQVVYLALASLAKLIVLPALVLGFGIVFDAPPSALAVALIFSAAPAAPVGFVLARQMGGDAELYSKVLVVQIFLALITVPLWVAIGALVLA